MTTTFQHKCGPRPFPPCILPATTYVPYMLPAAPIPASPPTVEMSPCGDVALSPLESALLDDLCLHLSHAELAEKHKLPLHQVFDIFAQPHI